MAKHDEVSPLKNAIVTLPSSVTMPSMAVAAEPTFQVEIEDWWDRINGTTWGNSDGNIAALNYAMRAARSSLPWDDEVLYGHSVDSGHGFLFHISEIITEAPDANVG